MAFSPVMGWCPEEDKHRLDISAERFEVGDFSDAGIAGDTNVHFSVLVYSFEEVACILIKHAEADMGECRK